MKTIVTNIQRFCLHDGPGIRTTIFLKGCSLHCPWCANPENINHEIEYYYDEDKCIKNNEYCDINNNCCVLKNDLSNKSLSQNCNRCLINAINKYGTELNIDEIEPIIKKDNSFYTNGGGVTFSGGEPLLNIDNLEPLLMNLKNKINIAVETCLFVPITNVQKALKYVDYFIVDFKIIDKGKCLNSIGGNIDLYLSNLKLILDNVDHSNILIRIPIINGYTSGMDNINNIGNFLSLYKKINIQIFSGHTLAEKKYKTLNKKILMNVGVSKEYLEEVKKTLEKKKLNVEVIKI